MMPQAQPALPGSMAGAPPGPGSSPAAAPGGGAGNEAAAIAALKGAFPLMYKALSAFPPGSEDWKHMHDAVESIGKIVGKAHDKESLVPSAIQQMARASKGGPLKAAPPIGIQPANTNIAPKAEPEPI